MRSQKTQGSNGGQELAFAAEQRMTKLSLLQLCMGRAAQVISHIGAKG